MPEDTYWPSPQADDDARRRLFLEFAAQGARGGHTGFFSQIARLELGLPIDESGIREALAHVDARHDCSDFAVAGLLRVCYQYSDSPLLSRDLLAEIQRCLLGFKYWIDEPGKEMMCFWSENHQIMFHALCSQHPYRWMAEAVFQQEGLRVDGRRNAYVCQLGRRETDGTFEQFADRIARSRVAFGDLTVRYDAPGLGEARIAWDGPFTLNGAPVPLRDYPRFDNPYCRAAFGARRFEIAHAGHHLRLDFENLERIST